MSNALGSGVKAWSTTKILGLYPPAVPMYALTEPDWNTRTYQWKTPVVSLAVVEDVETEGQHVDAVIIGEHELVLLGDEHGSWTLIPADELGRWTTPNGLPANYVRPEDLREECVCATRDLSDPGCPLHPYYADEGDPSWVQQLQAEGYSFQTPEGLHEEMGSDE